MVNALIAFIKSYAFKAIAALSGWRAALAKFVVDVLLKELRKLLIYLETVYQARKEAEEYKEKLKDETRTEEEIRKDDENFLK